MIINSENFMFWDNCKVEMWIPSVLIGFGILWYLLHPKFKLETQGDLFHCECSSKYYS